MSTLRAGHGAIFVPWTAVHDRLPYHHDLTRQAYSTLLPHQVGTVADRRCHNVRVVSVPRSPQAPLGVMLAEPRLADVVPWALLVTEKAWAVRAGFTLPDPGDVPPSTEEVAASAAYRARKRRHGDMERGGRAQPGPADPRSQAVASPGTPAGPAAFHTSGSPIHEPGSRGPGGVEEEARAWGAAGSSASPRGVAASPSAANADWDRYPAARDDGSGTAHDDRWANKWHEDYPGGAGADFESGWPTDAGGGAIGARPDHGDSWEGRDGRGADAEDDRAWPAASQDDGCGHAASGRYGPMGRSDHGQGRGGDAPGGRQWDAEPRRDGGGYPAAGVGAAARSQSDAHGGRHWGAEPRPDGGGYLTAGAGAAAGSQGGAFSGRHWDSEPRRDGGECNTAGAGTAAGPSSARWDAGPDCDGPAAALLELGFAGPVATPVPGQPDVAKDWWLSSLWVPPSPGTATAWRDSLTSGKVVDLFWAQRGRELGRGGPLGDPRRPGRERPDRARRLRAALPRDPADSGEAVPCRHTAQWGKPPDRGDTTPRHEPGTGREQSRNTPLGG